MWPISKIKFYHTNSWKPNAPSWWAEVLSVKLNSPIQCNILNCLKRGPSSLNLKITACNNVIEQSVRSGWSCAALKPELHHGPWLWSIIFTISRIFKNNCEMGHMLEIWIRIDKSDSFLLHSIDQEWKQIRWKWNHSCLRWSSVVSYAWILQKPSYNWLMYTQNSLLQSYL